MSKRGRHLSLRDAEIWRSLLSQELATITISGDAAQQILEAQPAGACSGLFTQPPQDQRTSA